MDTPLNDQHLIRFLESNKLFAPLDRQVLQRIAEALKFLSIQEEEYLFRYWETNNIGLYIVIDGELQAIICGDNVDSTVVGNIGPGEICGEMELITGQPRQGDVQATKDTQLYYLSKSEFEKIVLETPQIINLFGHVFRQRLRRNQLFQILPNYFGELNLEQMGAIEKEIEWIHLKRGQQFVRFQDPSDDFFIVINGRVQARVPEQDGEELIVADIYAGENVGELGFFTDKPRTANVYALRDSDLVRFSRDGFYAIHEKLPQTTLKFTQMLFNRLHSSVLGVKPSRKSLYVALVPLSEEVPLADFANRLAEAVSDFSRCVHLSSASVDEVLQPEGISQVPDDDLDEIRLITWLDEQEKICPVVCIYETDSGPSNWTRRCLQRVDRVIFVAHAGDELDLTFLREMMPSDDDQTIQKELVLLYGKQDSQPSGTAQWLNQIGDIQRHYHLRKSNDADYRRMARLITGKAIGLVLGGGGARGFTHIGVLRAIQEAGLEIDLVGGNSIGSVVAAGFALGMDWQQIAETCKKWAHKNELIDYTFPALSLMAGKRFTAKLRKIFNRKKIEDTWIEYFCVSANLTRARQVVHRRGELWKYIRASSAVFPIFPPVTDHGDLLVDGVLVNNLPIEVMRNICEDCTIIGVDISIESPLQYGYDFEPTLSGWEVLLRKLNPFQPEMDIPGFVNLFMRINEFSSVRQKFRQYDLTDYIIRPDIEEIGLFQFEDFDEIVELGYQAGKQALEKWRGQLWQK